MKHQILSFLLPLLLSGLYLHGQHASTIDSLKAALNSSPDSTKTQTLIDIAQQFFFQETPDSSIIYGQRAIDYASQFKDSLLLRNAFFLMAQYHLAKGDSLNAIKNEERLQTIASQWGLQPEREGMNGRYLYYDFSYFDVYNSLKILEDATGRWQIEDVKHLSFEQNNTLDNLDTSAVYWMKLKLRGPKQGGDTYLLSVGSGSSSWNRVDLFYERADSLIHQKSGFDLLASEKSCPDAFNWHEIDIEAGEKLMLYFRVEGFPQNDTPNRIFLQYLRPEAPTDFKGYRFNGQYLSPPMGNDFENNIILKHLEIVADSSGAYTFNQVRSIWEKKAMFNSFRFFSPDLVYWVKFRLIGTPQFLGNQLFSVGTGNEYNWRKISIYLPDQTGQYTLQKSGNDVPVWSKHKNHWNNIFEVNVPSNDTLEGYLRLEKMSRPFPFRNNAFYLKHIDSHRFWTSYTSSSLLFGLFLGAIGLIILYFLLLFFMEKDNMHLFFSLFLLGLITTILSSNLEEVQPLFHWVEYAPWITKCGEIMALTGLLFFSKKYLNLEELGIRLVRIIPYFIIVFAVIAGLSAYFFNRLNTSLIDFLYSFSLILSILFVFTLGISSWRKKHQPAAYYLLAFLFFFIGVFILALTDLLNLPYNNLLFAFQLFKVGIILTVIFFALGMGFRTRILRQQKTDAQIAQNKAEAAEAAAKEASEAKSAFLSTVSHELRTPLTSILGFTKLNKRNLEEKIIPNLKEESAKGHKAAKRISKNLDVVSSEGERLTNLINDLLDLAKIESGRLNWNMTEFDPKGLVEQAITTTSGLLSTKTNIKLLQEIPPSLPPIIADKERLLQVLINLISNAVKFTDVGHIKIGVHPNQDINNLEHGNQNTELLFFVEDTGSGIPPSHLDQVFEKFKQVDSNQTGKPKGTGLGLPICKEIVEHHGGRIWVESEVDKGSVFLFSVPLKNSGSQS